MQERIEKILVATDGSRDSELAARKATALAQELGAELHVVHVVPVAPPYYLPGYDSGSPGFYEEDFRKARDLLEEQVHKLREAGVEPAGSHLRTGEPDSEVVELAEEIGADLIVVGSRGASPLVRPLIGSVSSSIVTHAHCPVLVVRAEETALRRE
ncbi:universal stress protein [Rubrobacter taiwanensis]|jgi:nucleotide-binding universal stress UspA family protein|uniref:Universal stress protein n=1 Tax=Rubrobacter taiwanensis TaxID=185139 RepID=A0A4V2NW90_9ACTN|nr:universal stress protein [Rubrobacter taiwanensis]TCJ16422.1 universal stress protein [Rubrobacter taiwanensis]